MEIYIADEAQDYIKARGGEVVISTVVAKGCCGAMVREPITSTKLPKEIKSYRRPERTGITIYLPLNLQVKESGLVIKLSSIWKWKHLSVEGDVR